MDMGLVGLQGRLYDNVEVKEGDVKMLRDEMKGAGLRDGACWLGVELSGAR